jgi:hypothetical protein
MTIGYDPRLPNNYLIDYNNRWQKPGDEAFTNVPSFIYPVPNAVYARNNFYQNSELFVKRADNIRLQDARLSYQWDTQGKKLPFRSIQGYFYANNLNRILWRAADSRYDPDFSGGNSPFATPVPKTWTIGATVNF